MPNPFILPAIPAELQAIIDAYRERFAGWQVMADPPNTNAGKDGEDGAGADGADDADKDGEDGELGANGVKTLEKERTKRKALEKEVAGLKAFQTQFTQFVTGLTGGEQATTTEEGLKKVTDQVSGLTHQLLVERVARENSITDSDDVAMLSELKSEEAIRKLAARLKPADDNAGGDGGKGKGGGKQPPRPDPSAGKGGGDNAGKPGSVAEVMAARRGVREAKTKTN